MCRLYTCISCVRRVLQVFYTCIMKAHGLIMKVHGLIRRGHGLTMRGFDQMGVHGLIMRVHYLITRVHGLIMRVHDATLHDLITIDYFPISLHNSLSKVFELKQQTESCDNTIGNSHLMCVWELPIQFFLYTKDWSAKISQVYSNNRPVTDNQA